MNGFYCYFLGYFSWNILFFSKFFCFPSFFGRFFFFRAPGSDPRWSGVDSNLCVLKFHSPGAWPPPKVPTKKIPNTTQLLVNDGKHYFRVGSLSSNFKSLENGPAVPTKKNTPFLCFFGVPVVPEVRSFCGGFMFYFNHAFAPRLSGFDLGFELVSSSVFSLRWGLARWASMRRFPGFLVCFHLKRTA